MNKVIIEFDIGTSMGTKELNLEKYRKLWKTFEDLLEKEGLNLSSFAKKWEKYSDSSEENDYNKFYDKLKTQHRRKNTLIRVNANSIAQLKEYIKFLNQDYFTQELLDDEKPSSWFQ